MKTKERILQISVELFNKNGVTAVTTNHIAKALDISPGNLYFHFRNKEEIIFELFKKMARETYQIWTPRKISTKSLSLFIDENFSIYWKYRFFHREMYALRRKDPSLAKLWRAHLVKMMKLMEILYRKWVKQGIVSEISSRSEMQFLSDTLLAMATTFLQFFESAEKQPTERSILRGKRHLARLVVPYALGAAREELVQMLDTKI